MDPKTTALVTVVAALTVAAVAQRVVGANAAYLGLSSLELALLTGAVGAFISRTAP